MRDRNRAEYESFKILLGSCMRWGEELHSFCCRLNEQLRRPHEQPLRSGRERTGGFHGGMLGQLGASGIRVGIPRHQQRSSVRILGHRGK